MGACVFTVGQLLEHMYRHRQGRSAPSEKESAWSVSVTHASETATGMQLMYANTFLLVAGLHPPMPSLMSHCTPCCCCVAVEQGSSSLEGLLDGAVQQHDFVTVSRAAYTPGPKAWRLDAANTAPVIEGQHRSSAMLRSWAEVYTAVPGDDG